MPSDVSLVRKDVGSGPVQGDEISGKLVLLSSAWWETRRKPSTEVVGLVSLPNIYARLLAMIYSYAPVR